MQKYTSDYEICDLKIIESVSLFINYQRNSNARGSLLLAFLQSIP